MGRRRKDDYERRERKPDRRRYHSDRRHRHRRDNDSFSNVNSNTSSDSEESAISTSGLEQAAGTLDQRNQQQIQISQNQSSLSNNNNPYMNNTPYGIGYGYLPPIDTNMLIKPLDTAATIASDDSVAVGYPSNFGDHIDHGNNHNINNNISLQMQIQHQHQQRLPPINKDNAILPRTFGDDVNFSSDAESPNQSLNRKLKSLKLSDQSINRYHNFISSDDGHSISSNLSIPTSILNNKSITRKHRLGDVDSSTTDDASDIEIRITQPNRNSKNSNNRIRRNHYRSTSDILSDIRALSSHLDDLNEVDDDNDDNHIDDLQSSNHLPIRIPKNRHLKLAGDGSLNEMLNYAAVLDDEEIDDDLSHFLCNMKGQKEHN